jgi:RNA recognition motif-containing protein
MGNKLFVGSLSWDTTDTTLRDFFSTVGNVISASVIMDRQTGKSKGFGFVEMETAEKANEAIEQLNGKELDGRNVNVREALEKAPNSNFRRGPSDGTRRFGDNDRNRFSNNNNNRSRSRY